MKRNTLTAAYVSLLCLVPGCRKPTPESAASQPAQAETRPAVAPIEGTAFYDLSFADACTKAKHDGKAIMVDFYTTWCIPCKKLDKETWTDAAVRRWLLEKTVALRVDAEKLKELAQRYRIDGYPTMVFIKPEGTELGRVVGFREPKPFLAQAADALAGRNPADRLQEELKESGENDPMKRQQLGDELARQGKHAEALEQYLWCFDHGNEHGMGYFGVRLSFLLSSIAQLGQKYPPALTALRERRDRTVAAVLEGKADTLTALDISALNRELHEPERTLELYDQLGRDKTKGNAPLRTMLFNQVLDALIAAQRYQDVVDGAGDITATLQQNIAEHRLTAARFKDQTDSPVDYMRGKLVEKGAQYYEALLVVKQAKSADEVREDRNGRNRRDRP